VLVQKRKLLTKKVKPWFYVLIVFLFSCKNDGIIYEYISVQNNDVKLWDFPIPDKTRDIFENGDWVLKTPENDSIVHGKFEKGFREGTWTYFPSSTHPTQVNWSVYESRLLSINYPSEWKIYESNVRPFQAGFPFPEDRDDRYFIILSYYKDSVDMTLEEYWRLYNTRTFENDSIKSYIQYKFEQGRKLFYYSEYTLVRADETILLFNFLGEEDSMIYDITFSSMNINDEKKRIIFFEMIRSLFIKGTRFFSPYVKIDKIAEVRFNPLKGQTLRGS
jgi:hypothetical protein